MASKTIHIGKNPGTEEREFSLEFKIGGRLCKTVTVKQAGKCGCDTIEITPIQIDASGGDNVLIGTISVNKCSASDEIGFSSSNGFLDNIHIEGTSIKAHILSNEGAERSAIINVSYNGELCSGKGFELTQDSNCGCSTIEVTPNQIDASGGNDITIGTISVNKCNENDTISLTASSNSFLRDIRLRGNDIIANVDKNNNGDSRDVDVSVYYNGSLCDGKTFTITFVMSKKGKRFGGFTELA